MHILRHGMKRAGTDEIRCKEYDGHEECNKGMEQQK